MTTMLPDSFFRVLDGAAAEEFREYARTHDPDLTKWGILHPVCRAEWVRLGKGPAPASGPAASPGDALS